ncbi:hypothetical protein IP78_09730 [Brevundimonas sp. AAP58]|uniref:DUF3667 domain-containing protein n=1 Tax=Brevundimonas sp. AAP58 TaxID=1523422 RepID=UPI0006B98CB9|nr:DUF3667 domain-containing protein [Brevundimonas sp. AAP58]KPF79119.1 hypothetical protein IP78_09730 [Brevundimonas sp. AAP58]
MVDIDAAGGAATGGLIAAAVEKPTGHAGEPHKTCTDCGEPTSGKFCSNCGQATHVHRSLLHLFEEVLHGVLHFDARIWRTLPLLLLNPGRLTREWIQGKRTRYVSPLAIFLFTVFLMFFLMSFGGGGVVNVATLDERIATAREAVTQAEAAVVEAERDVAVGEPGAEAVLAGMRTAAEAARGELTRLEEARTAGPRADGYAPGSWQASVADAVRDGNVTIGVGDKKFQEKILEKLSNPDFAFYKVQQTLYKFAFLLVPLSIPFVWLLFVLKRGFTWYDHGVFVLYSLTFMAIFFMGLSMLDRIAGTDENWWQATVAGIGSILGLGVPVHMYAQLKGTYSLGWFSALWRTFVLMLFSLFVFTLFLVGVILFGLGF